MPKAENRTADEIEAQRVEDERVEAERLEAERLEQERLDAEGEDNIDPATGKPKVAAPADDSVVVSIGDEVPPTSEEDDSKAPEWVRELRKNQKELLRRNRELEDQVKATTGAVIKPVEEVGPAPKLEDFEYDTEKFNVAYTKWHGEKIAGDAAKQARTDEEARQKAEWQGRLTAYGEAKTKLKVPDFDGAEAVVQSLFSTTQQGVMLHGSDNSAVLVYALGKNPKKAKELADIKDPVKFAFAVAKLETQLKVKPRKAPAPEGKLEGTAGNSGAVDSTLEKLRAEAEKTGDYTKVNAHKRAKREGKK